MDIGVPSPINNCPERRWSEWAALISIKDILIVTWGISQSLLEDVTFLPTKNTGGTA